MMKPRRLIYLLCITSLLTAFVITPCVHAKIIVVGGLTHEYQVKQGEVISGTILIKNTGEVEEEVKLYQTDYHFTCDGTNEYADPGSLVRSNAIWIVFSPKQMVIPPNEETAVEYRIHIPQDDNLKGTFWSMMMVEAIPKSTYDVGRMNRGVGIDMIMRYGIQMVTHLGESGTRQIQFLNAALQNEEEGVQLHVDIANTGECWLRPEVWVEMYDQEGTLVGNFKGQSLRTYPGTSIRQRFDLTGMSTGSYKALVVADCGEEDLFGIQYSIMIE